MGFLRTLLLLVLLATGCDPARPVPFAEAGVNLDRCLCEAAGVRGHLQGEPITYDQAFYGIITDYTTEPQQALAYHLVITDDPLYCVSRAAQLGKEDDSLFVLELPLQELPLIEDIDRLAVGDVSWLNAQSQVCLSEMPVEPYEPVGPAPPVTGLLKGCLSSELTKEGHELQLGVLAGRFEASHCQELDAVTAGPWDRE